MITVSSQLYLPANKESNIGIKDCADVWTKNDLGPVVNNLGISPLKSKMMHLSLKVFLRMVNPPSGLSLSLFFLILELIALTMCRGTDDRKNEIWNSTVCQ